MSEEIKIAHYGGGVNSTAMLIFMVQSGIIPHAILFSDTGGEKSPTYAYTESFSKWLVKNGFPPITRVKFETKDGVNITLEQDILNNGTLPAIAFGFKSCSDKFKIQPQTKWLNKMYPKAQIVHYIGFDAGERRRVRKNDNPKHINNYPLIESGWDRERCMQEIIKVGLCVPPKSSCFFCPNMKKGEILQLPEDLRDRVRIIEKNAKNKVELKGLGRSFSWTDLFAADKDQLKAFDDLEMYQDPCNCTD